MNLIIVFASQILQVVENVWNWLLRQAFERLACSPRLIVTSRLADEYLWVEVLNRGGYDVLTKPLDKREVARVVNSARQRWTGPQEQMSQIRLAGV